MFSTNPEYLPETLYVWQRMVDVTDRIMAQTNERWFGLYFGGAVGMWIGSNGKKATFEFGRSDHMRRSGEPAIKFVKISGSKVRIKLF